MFSVKMTWRGLIPVLILSRNAFAQSKESAMAQHTSYRTVKVDGLSIFYREAGPKDAQTLGRATGSWSHHRDVSHLHP
jgi:hypothetical protein